MTTPYLAEIQIFGFDFAPRGWALCNGDLLPIQQNTALFSLIGASYGGNGKTSFRLPNLANRAMCSEGKGAGLTPRVLGQAFGANEAALGVSQMPSHGHAFTVYNQPDTSKKSGTPAPGSALTSPGGIAGFAANAAADAGFAPAMIGASGGGQAHENRQPFLALNFCIALQGLYPSFG